MKHLTQEYLKEFLDYSEETGRFTWRKSTTNTIKVGDIAGTKHIKGYISIGLERQTYLAHRLAWLYVYGVFPKDQLDHINRVKTDNRICNLRECQNFENHQNKEVVCSPSKLPGITWWRRDNTWKAQISFKGKNYHLGYFKTQEEAHIAYLKAKERLHTFHPTL